VIPNLFIMDCRDGLYGLHRMNDGEVWVVKKHVDKGWFTYRLASEQDKDVFVRNGMVVAQGGNLA
jgi:hypothetical protein